MPIYFIAEIFVFLLLSTYPKNWTESAGPVRGSPTVVAVLDAGPQVSTSPILMADAPSLRADGHGSRTPQGGTPTVEIVVVP